MSLSAKLAAVLSDREVAFNQGADAGIEVGDIATLFEETEVDDPATGESLGVVRRPAVRFQIFEVQPRLSVGRTYELRQKDVAAGALAFSFNLYGSGDTVRVTEFGDRADWRTVAIAVGAEVLIQRPKKEE